MTFEVTYKWFEKQMKGITDSIHWLDKLWDADVFSDTALDHLGEKIAQTENMLTEIMGDVESGWIGYWLYELECGKRWEPGSVEDDDGKEVKLETIQDLWNVLTEKK